MTDAHTLDYATALMKKWGTLLGYTPDEIINYVPPAVKRQKYKEQALHGSEDESGISNVIDVLI